MVGGLRFLHGIGEDEDRPFIIDHVVHPEVIWHEQVAAVALFRALEAYPDARAFDPSRDPGMTVSTEKRRFLDPFTAVGIVLRSTHSNLP
jgi:hypothetical protein